MKFSIERTKFVETLGKLQGITGRKSNLAITENVLIKSMDSKIFIAATDLETGFEGIYAAEVESDGIITINSKKLYEIIKNFPDEHIFVTEAENRWLKIGNETVEYNIVGMNPNDFPEIPQIADADFFELDSIILKKMIDKTTMIGTAGEEKRAHILGVNFECITSPDGHIIRMISTDGKRLSKVDHIYTGQSLGMTPGEQILIPKKGLHEVSKVLENEGTVHVGVKENHFIMKKENETVIVSLLEGDFPQYAELLEIGDKHTIEFQKQNFKMMLKRMSILTSEDYKGVYFNFNENRLTITAANPNVGDSKEDMQVNYQHPKTEIAFNPYFFIDAINNIESDTICVHLIDDENPCLVEGKNDKTFLSVIMPMKL